MGCFSLSKSKRRARDRLPPAPQPAGLIYNNKPTALPNPLEVETGVYGRYLSAPPSVNDRRCTLPACASPLSNIEPLTRSAPPSLNAGKNEADYNTLPKRQQEGNGCTALCSRRVRPAPKRIQRSMSASWHSSPLVDSFKVVPASSHSGPLFSISSNCDSRNGAALQSCRYVYSGRPLPLPPPQLSGIPLPLPLPQDLSLRSPQVRHVISASSLASSPTCSAVSLGSFHDGFNPLTPGNNCLHPKPLPTPEVVQPRQLRSFPLQEIETRCLDFSLESCIGETCSGTMYRTWIDEESGVNPKQKIEVVILRPREQWPQDDEEFFADFTSLAEAARNSNLCTLIGYSMERTARAIGDKLDAKKRLLIYEHLPNGSLDRHLYRREEHRSPLSWSTRMKIALDAARGLMQLHVKFPHKAMYWDFRPLYIQLDSTFSGKLTGYGLTKSFNTMGEIDKSSTISAYVAPETAEKGELTVQSNVWSFGVVLLELLTGRPSWDKIFSADERDLVKWCKSFLKDAAKLCLVVDPELKSQYPARDAKIVGNLALQCLQKDSHLRPHIGYVVEVLKSVQRKMSTPGEHKYEPAECIKNSASKCRSLKEILHESDPEDDSSGCSTSSKAPGPVKLHEQLLENLKASLFRRFLASRSSLSCSSSLALERKQNSTIAHQVKLSQTGCYWS